MTLPFDGSAILSNMVGLTSMSTAAQPVPDIRLAKANCYKGMWCLSSQVLTPVNNSYVDASILARLLVKTAGSDLPAAQWVGVWVRAGLLSIPLK